MKDGTGVGSFRDDIEKWADIWAQAQAEGGFGDSKPDATPKASSEGGFFGLHSQQEPAAFDQDDFDVWDKVSGQSPAVLQEAGVGVKLSSPNPVPAWTMGPDSGVIPGETDAFFTSQDIDRLSGMKVELDRLQERIGTAAAKGQDVGSFTQKVRKLLVKIDDLSNAMSDYSRGD